MSTPQISARNRNAWLLHDLPPSSRVIEIGPSYSPVAAKAKGWNTTVVDHASHQDLVSKYSVFPQVDTRRIEPVDLIWRSGPLLDVFPPHTHGTYDAFVASHVIEHVPDMVDFLNTADRLLGPKGKMILAIPDKRVCFDCLRPVSTTGQVLAAARGQQTRHAHAAIFDHHAYFALPRDGSTGWERKAGLLPEPFNPVEVAHQAMSEYSGAADKPYADVHGWVFTPASFELIILELGAVHAIDWRIEAIAERSGLEFLVRLVRGAEQFGSPGEFQQRRTELLRRALFEIREQTDWYLAALGQLPADPTEQPRARRVITHTMNSLRAQAAKVSIVREALRSSHALWIRLLPLRRIIARARGRIP